MKLCIMQPYFFPYLGYFDLLHNVDLFIVYDTIQYIKQGWINRNRILHPNKIGWQYISVPVNKASFHSSYRTSIDDVKITDNKPWKQHILGQLAHYKKTASHADEVLDFVKNSLAVDETYISRLNVHILACCANLLNINFQYLFCSEIGIELNTKRSPEERILDLCESFGAKEYVNLPGGVDLYHPEAFESRNIRLSFRRLPPLVYPTEQYVFEPNLSIIDILMWNRPEDIKKYLDDHKDIG